MIKIEWDSCLLKEDMMLAFSAHALDRALERGNAPIQQVRNEVETLIHQAENELIRFSDKFRTFVIKGKDKLSVVGSLLRRGKDFIFKVITLHKKDNFVANNPNDKVINVSEDLESDTKITTDQIILGLRTEEERIPNARIALKIVMDNLNSDSNFYDHNRFPVTNKSFPYSRLIMNEPEEDSIFMKEDENPIITALKQVFKEDVSAEMNSDWKRAIQIANDFIMQQYAGQQLGVQVVKYHIEGDTAVEKLDKVPPDEQQDSSLIEADFNHDYVITKDNITVEVSININETLRVKWQHEAATRMTPGSIEPIIQTELSHWAGLWVQGTQVPDGEITPQAKDILTKTFNKK